MNLEIIDRADKEDKLFLGDFFDFRQFWIPPLQT